MKHPVSGLSPTHIKTFLTCPYQYYAKRLQVAETAKTYIVEDVA